MALQLQKVTPTTHPTLEKFRDRVTELLAEGLTVAEIAQTLVPDDYEKRNRVRRRIWRMIRRDSLLQARIVECAQGEMLVGLPHAARGMSMKAGRSVPAAKLLFEATGFHNPRVKHEHTGDIKITIDMPRPTFTDGSITDADVVEDGSGGRE